MSTINLDGASVGGTTPQGLVNFYEHALVIRGNYPRENEQLHMYPNGTIPHTEAAISQIMQCTSKMQENRL